MNLLEVLAFCCLILVTITLVYVTLERFSSPIRFTYQYEPQPLGEVTEFTLLAKRFAGQHEYDLENYNCVNYSTELKEIADQLGFKTQMVVGCTDDDNITCHQWLRLEVDFEPQWGEFIDYSGEYPDQEVLE